MEGRAVNCKPLAPDLSELRPSFPAAVPEADSSQLTPSLGIELDRK